jgi:hypothetical protein
VCVAVPKVPLELVEIVRALAPSTRVLAIHWPYTESTRADAEHQRILRAHSAIVFSVPLHGEVEHGLLVLVREKTEEHKRWRRGGCWGDILQVDCHSCAGLSVYVRTRGRNQEQKSHLYAVALELASSLDVALCPPEVLELKDPSVVTREVLVRVPWTRSHRAKSTVPLEPGVGGDVHRSVDLVRELKIVLLFPFTVSPLL